MEKTGFQLPKNTFPLARMNDLFQKCISNVRKIDKIMAYLRGFLSDIIVISLISVTVSTSRKELSSRVDDFH